MELILKIVKEEQILILLLSIMTLAYIFKKEGILTRVYSFLVDKLHLSNKTTLTILSMVLGVLPIPGRTAASNLILDTLQDRNRNNTVFGTISYLATHHYYLWSPLEKSVVISCSLLSMAYTDFLYIMMPFIIGYLGFLVGFIIRVSDEIVLLKPVNLNNGGIKELSIFVLTIIGIAFGINITLSLAVCAAYYLVTFPITFSEWKKAMNWKLIMLVGIVVIIGVCLNEYKSYFETFIKGFSSAAGISIIGLACFIATFILGSSARFATFAAFATMITGMQYFVFFYIIDYCAYLLSPSHKCIYIANVYFNTPFRDMFRVILALCAFMCLILIGKMIMG